MLHKSEKTPYTINRDKTIEDATTKYFVNNLTMQLKCDFQV
jgi:hypothetical protein